MLVWAAAAGADISFYAADYSGNMYQIDSTSGGLTSTLMGPIQNDGLTTLVRGMAMDIDPAGNLTMYNTRSVRRQFSRYYKYGEVYQVDPSTVPDNAAGDATELFDGKSFGSFGFSGTFDAGLAFRSDGSFYSSGDGNTLGKQLWLTDTSGNTKIYNKSNYFAYYGLEWYDDGTAAGLLLGLQETNSGALLLHKINVNETSMGFYSQSFATLPSGAGLRNGDLSICDDTLYIMMSGSTGSQLYSYDLLQGSGGSVVSLGSLSQGDLRSLSAIPCSVPVPGAALMGSLGLSVAGWVIRRRRPAA